MWEKIPGCPRLHIYALQCLCSGVGEPGKRLNGQLPINRPICVDASVHVDIVHRLMM